MLIQPKTFEFNTLEIIYQKPSEAFTKSFEYFMNQRNKEKALKMDEDEDANINTEEQTAPPTPVAGAGPLAGDEVDLLNGGGATNTTSQAAAGGLSEEDQGRL